MNTPTDEEGEYRLPDAPEAPASKFHTRLALMLLGVGAAAAGLHFVPQAPEAVAPVYLAPTGRRGSFPQLRWRARR